MQTGCNTVTRKRCQHLRLEINKGDGVRFFTRHEYATPIVRHANPRNRIETIPKRSDRHTARFVIDTEYQKYFLSLIIANYGIMTIWDKHRSRGTLSRQQPSRAD